VRDLRPNFERRRSCPKTPGASSVTMINKLIKTTVRRFM
jgi:hypothetical protein